MNGTPLCRGVATVFLASTFGVPLDTPALLSVVAMAIVAAIGSPGTPGAGIIVPAMPLEGVATAAAAIALVLGVDRLLAMARMAVNVAGDTTACVVMERLVARPGAAATGEVVARETRRPVYTPGNGPAGPPPERPMASTCPFLLRANEIEQLESGFSHPWNPRSRVIGARLARSLGLQRTGVTLARVPAGMESFVYHAHHHEEEWLYILSGCAIAEVDDQEVAVGPGDFLAFPTPSVAHHLRNPFDYDLVYLMGGENRACEVADFPRLGRRTVRSGDELTVYELADGRPFAPPEPDEADGGAGARAGDAA